MPKEHVAFFSFPHYPDVNPTLAVVSTLVRRGYRVTYVTSDRFASAITDLGAEHVSCPRFVNPFDPSARESPTVHPAILLAERTLAEVVPFYETNRPDLIVYDFLALSGRILARHSGIPAIQTSPAFAFDRHHLNQQLQQQDFQDEVLTESRDMNQFLARHAVKDGNCPFYREKLNIYFYPKVFQLLGEAFDDDRCFYAGRCAPERPYRRKWQPPSPAGRPILLVSTSTGYIQGPDYYRMCIRALSGLKWHVLLAIGENNDPAAFEPLPPHFEIVRNVLQIEILPHADLQICLGGMITTVEAMYHGVPLLMLTHGRPEPEAYAENNAKLGIGKHLRQPEMTADRIRSTILTMSEDVTLRERVKQIQQTIVQEPGAEETVNRITRYLDAARL